MSKPTSNKFSPEVRSRAVRLVLDHEHEHPMPVALPPGRAKLTRPNEHDRAA
jgi:hypothetical protein